MSNADSRFRRTWWPTLDNSESAKGATREGAWAALIVAVGTALIATLNIEGVTNNFMGENAWAYVDASAFLILSILVFRFSRIAALLALIFYLGERISILVNVPYARSNLLVAAIFVMAFVNGIRGAFAWHRFRQSATLPPNAPAESN